MKTSTLFPKYLGTITLFILLLVSTRLLVSMDSPVEFDYDQSDSDEIEQITRYGSIPEFHSILTQLSAQRQVSALRFSDQGTLLHVVASRFKTTELKDFNEVNGTHYTHAHIARLQALKTDLLLKNGGVQAMTKKNEQDQTPVMLAAQSGNLTVLARLMIAEPVDWKIALQAMPQQQVCELVNNFIEMMSIKHLYPKIETGLHVNLPTKQLSDLYTWAIETQQDFKYKKITTNVLETRSFEDLKYLFDSFLRFDLYTQCHENKHEPQAQELLGLQL